MARHPFNFEGGEELTTMGATWFVSYLYHKKCDPSHTNWNKIKTCSSRKSVCEKTAQYHKFWLRKILDMDDARLNTNTICLKSPEIKRMTKALLEII